MKFSIPLTFYLPLLAELCLVLAADDSLGCKFTKDRFKYDLCPIFNSRENTSWNMTITEETPPTRMHKRYVMALRPGGLKVNKNWDENLQCPDGTWICESIINTIPGEDERKTSRILQVIPVAAEPGIKASARLSNDTWAKTPRAPPILNLHLHGGHYNKKDQGAIIMFKCDKEAEELASPKALGAWNNTHWFSWTTKYGCPTGYDRPTPTGTRTATHNHPKPTDEIPDSDEELPTHPEDDPSNEFRLPDGRPSYFTIFSSILVVLGILFVLHKYSPQIQRNRLLKRFNFINKSKRKFRPTPEGLLLWAQQQPDYDDVDLVATGPVQYNREVDEVGKHGEEIPLSPSPRATFGKGGKPMQSPGVYGSFGV